MSRDTVTGMPAVAPAIAAVGLVDKFAPFCSFLAASSTFQLSPRSSGAASGSVLATYSAILTASLASRCASARGCIQDVCAVRRAIRDACTGRPNLDRVMLSLGHVVWNGQQDGSVRRVLCGTRVAAGSNLWLGRSAQLQVRVAVCGTLCAAALVSSESVATAQSAMWRLMRVTIFRDCASLHDRYESNGAFHD